MPSELPYAADAEVSLSYDELEVSTNLRERTSFYILAHPHTHRTGSAHTISERTDTRTCHSPNEIQLCVGFGQEPFARASG